MEAVIIEAVREGMETQEGGNRGREQWQGRGRWEEGWGTVGRGGIGAGGGKEEAEEEMEKGRV